MDALSDFIRVVRFVDGEATARDVADILWLAGHLKGASPSWRHLVEDERAAGSPEACGPSADGKAEPDEAAAASEPRPAAGEAGLHAATGPAGAGEPGGEPFPAPTLPALPGRAELYRALWPLKRRVDSRIRTTTDVRATADFIAETGIPCPVLRPEKERWLDAALVVEDSPSMAVWRRTVRELHQVLVRSGIFRDVRIWRFAWDADGWGMRLHEGFSGPMPPGPGRHPSALAHPDGRRLILMVSDAVSRAWHEGWVYRMARHWEKGAVTALVQMMPYWLWERTGLDRAISARLVSAGAGEANHRLRIAGPRRVLRTLAPKTEEEGWRETAPKRLHLPVVMLSPDFLGPLADSISGRRYHRLPGVVYDEARFPAAPPPVKGDAESSKPHPDPEKLVNDFRSRASHPARRLASFLAASPLTLPIMRAVQGKMLPDSRQYHLAEVMLSGMVFRKSSRETWLPSDEIGYEFFPGVRERLLAESRRDETLDVLVLVCDELSAFVDENTGRRESFRAVLAGGGDAGERGLKIEHEPFAGVAAFVLKRLGGRYARIAADLERRLTESRGELVQKEDDYRPFIALRDKPITVDSADDFERKDIQNDYIDNSDGTITDRATGLMWEQSGSGKYMQYGDAEKYVSKLNQKKIAGKSDWRLPTVDELWSLMEKDKKNDNLYIDPIFDSRQRQCWSSDKRSSGSAWVVNFNFRYVHWFDLGLYDYVRCVRSGQY